MNRISVEFIGDYPAEFLDYILSETLADMVSGMNAQPGEIKEITVPADDNTMLVIKINPNMGA